MSKLMRAISDASVWESTSMNDYRSVSFVCINEVVFVISCALEYGPYCSALTSRSCGFVLRSALKEL